ncbi:IS200/IS605 family transposase [Paraflavisolibacter sp. H34]|uniref:IS200/IS605 family transposase n=1 Tax=Huijunlia imazamoxiresistens TaxID=3127457 RepID=UPI00301B2F48
MSNTYTQIHLQFVFAVQHRAALINASWKERLHQYLTGLIQNYKHKMLQINSMPDHIHILIGLRPSQAISEIVQHVKTESTKWINDCRLTPSRFAWQEGYGCFSYSKSSLPQVIRYIQNQEKHHQKVTFLQEYKAFLDAFEVEYDPRYLFKEPE